MHVPARRLRLARPSFRIPHSQFLIAIVTAVVLAASASAQTWTMIVEAPPALAGAARELERLNPAPLAQALERAGLPTPERIRVRLLTNDDLRARTVPMWIVGQASGTSDMVIFPERISSYPYGSLETVFRHEIVHLALNAAAGRGRLPRWFHEGVAVSIESDWGVADTLRLLLAAVGGPDVSEVSRLFESDNQPEAVEAYLLAAALVDAVRRRHGAAMPGAITAGVARGLSFDEAFARQTGETPDEAAAAAWATYRQVTAWLPVVTSVRAVWTLILALAFLAFVVRLKQRVVRRRQWADDEEK